MEWSTASTRHPCRAKRIAAAPVPVPKSSTRAPTPPREAAATSRAHGSSAWSW